MVWVLGLLSGRILCLQCRPVW